MSKVSEVGLTAAQTANEIGVSVHTLRNWVRDFKTHIPFTKAPNGYNLYTQDAINVFLQIKTMLYDQNLSSKQIEAILSGASRPTVSPDNLPAVNLQDELQEIKDLLQQQQEFNKALVNRLQEQEQRMEQLVSRRDEQLMLALREIRENKNDKPWYKRLLGK